MIDAAFVSDLQEFFYLYFRFAVYVCTIVLVASSVIVAFITMVKVIIFRPGRG